MKFLGKRFMPVDNINKSRAIFIVGEAADGLTRYVALIDLYNIQDRWVEIMSITNVSTDPEANSSPVFQGMLRKIENDQEWQAAVACFNAHRVFEDYDWNQVEKRVVDQRIQSRLKPYGDWWFDRKKGVDNLLPEQKKTIDDYTSRFKEVLDQQEEN